MVGKVARATSERLGRAATDADAAENISTSAAPSPRDRFTEVLRLRGSQRSSLGCASARECHPNELGSTLCVVQSRVPEEWRIPIAFAVVWVVPLVVAVARPSWWEQTHGHVEAPIALALLVVLVAWLLRRSRVAWWIFVVVYVGAIPTWIHHVYTQGLGIAWAFWGVLTLVNFVLLVSAPMRRFVRLRGRLAADPN
jgi:hypothetical protein